MKKLVHLQRVFFLFTCVMLACVNASAQHLTGSVIDSLGNPIANAEVVELSSSHRVLNHTTTTEKGLFSIHLSNNQRAHISVRAEGYVQLTTQVVPEQKYRLMLQKKHPSPLQLLKEKYEGKPKKSLLTNKLLCGRYRSREVPWLVKLEYIGDNTFLLQLPIKSETEYGVYREGRMTVVETNDLQHVLELYNSNDCIPVEGSPNEKETWERFSGKSIGVQPQWSWYSDDVEDKVFYYYPTYILTKHDLEQLIFRSSEINRILLDNEAADNFWIMYPMKGFAKELKKAMLKLAF